MRQFELADTTVFTATWQEGHLERACIGIGANAASQGMYAGCELNAKTGMLRPLVGLVDPLEDLDKTLASGHSFYDKYGEDKRSAMMTMGSPQTDIMDGYLGVLGLLPTLVAANRATAALFPFLVLTPGLGDDLTDRIVDAVKPLANEFLPSLDRSTLDRMRYCGQGFAAAHPLMAAGAPGAAAARSAADSFPMLAHLIVGKKGGRQPEKAAARHVGADHLEFFRGRRMLSPAWVVGEKVQEAGLRLIRWLPRGAIPEDASEFEAMLGVAGVLAGIEFGEPVRDRPEYTIFAHLDTVLEGAYGNWQSFQRECDAAVEAAGFDFKHENLCGLHFHMTGDHPEKEFLRLPELLTELAAHRDGLGRRQTI